MGEFTDHYVKLRLPPPGASYAAPFDPDAICDEYVQQFASAVRKQVGVSTNTAAVGKLKRTLQGGGAQ